MDDAVTVIRDETQVYRDGTVASVRVLSVPESDRFPDGLKYSFHYGRAEGDAPIVRFDNHHGSHHLHVGSQRFDVDFPGLEATYRAWRSTLPDDKRDDW